MSELSLTRCYGACVVHFGSHRDTTPSYQITFLLSVFQKSQSTWAKTLDRGSEKFLPRWRDPKLKK